MDPFYSFEIKTCSHSKSIFGNSSNAQRSQTTKRMRQVYLSAVNFQGSQS